MSSQLQPTKPQPVQANPYANIPGYRTNEPANSAWNRTILSYKAAGVPYTIERQTTEQPSPPPKSSLPSSNILGPFQPTKSTNPQYEAALMESFAKQPQAFTSTNYFQGLFQRGVLTSSDYDKLTQIVTSYNAKVEQQNKEAQNVYNLGQGLYSLAQKEYQAQKLQSFSTFKTSQSDFTNFLSQYEKQNATFQIIDKSGKVVGTTSGQRSYHDVLAAQKQFGQVTVQPVLPTQQQAEKPFSIKEYVAGGISGFQKALTTGKEPSPVNYFIDVGKGAASFFYQGAKQLAATAPIIGQELFSTITTGRTQYQIKGATPISGFAASFLQPQLGFTPYQQSQYQANIKSIDAFIGSVKTQAKQQGLVVPAGIFTPTPGSAGAAIGSIIGIGLSLYGTKELAPIRYEKYALPLGETKEIVTKTLIGAPTKEQVPVFSTVYKGLTLGYGAGKPIIGSYSGKISLGLKPELLKYPEAAASGTRFELGTGTGFETRIFQAEKTQSYLKKQGLLPERTEKAVSLGIRITKESAKTPEVQFQKGYSFTQEPFLKLQGKEQTGALEFLASRQSFVRQAGKGTRIGRVHGSLSEIPVAVPELALKAHDIDVRVSSDILGEKSAKGLSEHLQGLTSEGRTFTSEGKKTILTTDGTEEKIAEFLNMEKAVEYSSATQSSERVFGQKLPTEFKRYSISPRGPKLKVTPGRFQTLRRSASVFSLKGEKNPVTGKYEFQVGPEPHRLKDVAKLYARQLSEAQANFLKGSEARGFRQQAQARELKDIFGKQIDVEKYIMQERLGLTKPEPIQAEAAKTPSQSFKDISSGVISSSKNITPLTAISSSSPTSRSSSRNIKDLSKSSEISSKSSSSFESLSRPSGISRTSKTPSYPSGISPFKSSKISRPSSGPSKPFSGIMSPPSRPPPSPPSQPPSTPPSSPPSIPPYYPPEFLPGNKKIPSFPFGLGTTEGPGSPVFGGGTKKSFLGNVPEFQFTGMYNRIETVYGRGGKAPKEYRSSKPASNAFTKLSGQGKKSSSKPTKPLSNKFNRLI